MVLTFTLKVGLRNVLGKNSAFSLRSRILRSFEPQLGYRETEGNFSMGYVRLRRKAAEIEQVPRRRRVSKKYNFMLEIVAAQR